MRQTLAASSSDPVTLEILWSRLINIMDEVDTALVRTAFSTIVGEAHDFACILLDAQGCSLAQSNLSTTAFTVTLPATTKHLLAVYPPETLKPGDVLVTNDPWLGSGHLPDFSVVAPVFHRSRLVAFMGTVAHLADVGGRLGYFSGLDIFEEGIRLPPCRLFKGGQEDSELMRLLASNVRVPDLVLGDLRAIAAGQALGARRLTELLEDHRLSSLSELSEVILTRSDRAMREAIAELPAGVYEAEHQVDGYDELLTVRCRVQIGIDSILVDYAGSSPQTNRAAINCPMASTRADTVYAMKCVLAPGIPNNEGLFRSIAVTAPDGCIYNAKPPVPVQARAKTSMHLHAAIFSALADVAPSRVQADSGGSWAFAATGLDASGLRYSVHLITHGGKGACESTEGLPTLAFPYNASTASIEVLENAAPLLIERKALRPDSGGPGKHRGGLGQEVVIRSRSEHPMMVWVRPNRVRVPAFGLKGGQPGKPGYYSIRGLVPDVPTMYQLNPGETVILGLPGGGGFGDPRDRSPAAIAEDLREGHVTPSSVRDVYGMNPEEHDARVDVRSKILDTTTQ